MIRVKGGGPIPLITMEFTPDPLAEEKDRKRAEQADQNWRWFIKRASEIYERYRGQHVSISSEEVFAADDHYKAAALAKAAHPEDEGRLSFYFPQMVSDLP